MSTNDKLVIYQAPGKYDIFCIKDHLRRNAEVWVIEPFPVFKREQGGVFLQRRPDYIEKLIQNNSIKLLKTAYINAKDIYLASAEKAVSVIENIYPLYRKQNVDIIQNVIDTLGSDDAEKIFKNDLCGRLAEFYSINIMLHRIERHFNMRPILFYPDVNTHMYSLIRSMLIEGGQDVFDHPGIRFSLMAKSQSLLNNWKKAVICLSLLGGQTIGSCLFGKKDKKSAEKKFFRYGITIVSPRQFRKNERSMDFLVDRVKIRPEEVVYIPMLELSSDSLHKVTGTSSAILSLPRRGKYFSNFKDWAILLTISFRYLKKAEELYIASLAFFIYFKWKNTLKNVHMKHFITHSDFGISHIGRNIALNQSGVQTWYFIDSISYELNYREKMGSGKLFPFWTYLHYDHLISWHQALCDYLEEHPGSFKKTHVVGSIWGAHIKEKNEARKNALKTYLNDLDQYFVIACFDSTYLMNSHISYADGILFANDLYQLIMDYDDICILFKEKKDRQIHQLLDPILGPKLVDTYQNMGRHARIRFFDNQSDTSELISICDMVITFPFSSPTFEALSRNRPAIWHDAHGDYRKTIYAACKGVLTHSYKELKNKVEELKRPQPAPYQNPIPVNSPLMDPYRDGKAIVRFIDLLSADDQ